MAISRQLSFPREVCKVSWLRAEMWWWVELIPGSWLVLCAWVKAYFWVPSNKNRPRVIHTFLLQKVAIGLLDNELRVLAMIAHLLDQGVS